MSDNRELDRSVTFYPGEEEYRSNFRKEESVVSAVVEAVAAVKEEDPLELTQLNSVVDPEALDALFNDTRTNSREGVVKFVFEGFQVALDFSEELIRLQPASEDTGSL